MCRRGHRHATREHAEHSVDDAGVPLRPAAFLQNLQRLARRNRLAVWPLAYHCVKRIRYGDHPRLEGDARAVQAIRIARTIEALVMRAHDHRAAL